MLKTKLGLVEEFLFVDFLICTFHTGERNLGPLPTLLWALPSSSSTWYSFGQPALSPSVYGSGNINNTDPVLANGGHISLTTVGKASSLWANNSLENFIKLLEKIGYPFSLECPNRLRNLWSLLLMKFFLT